MKLRFLGATLAAMVTFAPIADAQEWPTRPVTMVVPFAPGGPTDLFGRTLAQYMSEHLGQQVVIENVSGAGGMTGSNRVAKAAPDGYVFGLGAVSTHAQNQTLYKKPLYNSIREFAPVALIAEMPLVMISRKDFPASNLREIVAYDQANQTKLTFGSGGAGSVSHLGCVLLNSAMGTNIIHVPYRGTAPAMQDLQAGRIDFICDIITTALPQIEGKAVKPIATLTRERTPVLPDLPTAHEQGMADFDANNWYAFFLPSGTPEPIVNKLNAAAVQAMNSSALRDRLQGLGATVVAPERRTSQYLAEFLGAEIAKWAAPIKSSGVSID